MKLNVNSLVILLLALTGLYYADPGGRVLQYRIEENAADPFQRSIGRCAIGRVPWVLRQTAALGVYVPEDEIRQAATECMMSNLPAAFGAFMKQQSGKK
jgi:hypothetical protein